MSSNDAIRAIGPESGELLARGERHHRVLAELPEYELIELRFGPDELPGEMAFPSQEAVLRRWRERHQPG